MPAEPSSPPSWCTGYPSGLRPREDPGWWPVLPQSVALPDWDLQMNVWQLFWHKVHFWDGRTYPRCLGEPDQGRALPVLTLCFLRSDLGEERNLGHRHKRQAQNLQKHSDDELSQNPWEVTCTKQSRKINQVSNIATYLSPFLARKQPVRANQSMRLEPKGLVMKMRHQMLEMLQIAKPMASTTRSATRRLSQRTNRKPAITSMPQRQYMMLFSSSPYPKNFWVRGVTIVWRGDNSTEPLTDAVHDIRRDGYISACWLNLQCRLIEECDELSSQKHDHLLSQELYRQSDSLGLISEFREV